MSFGYGFALPRIGWRDGRGSGGSYPANLAFYAWDTQSGVYDSDVIVGEGSITEASTSTRHYPDENNVWQPFTSGQVGRYYYDGDYWYPYHCGFTNSVTFSTDLTNVAWLAVGASVAKNQIGMRGDANGASLVAAATASATVTLAAPVVAASAAHGSRWFLKRSVGTGTVEITMDNGATWTGVTMGLAAASGWYEVAVSQTLANPQIGIRLVTSGDAVIVGNAELAVNPTIGSETAAGILRWNSPVFTAGATGSVTETVPTVSGSNHDASIGFWYRECVTASEDADYGLMDIYFPSFSASNQDATPCNFANGSLWSTQYLQPAAGGSTTQVTRPAVSGSRFRVTTWYSAAEASANFALDGDLTSGASTFSSYSSDGSMYLIRKQSGAGICPVMLVRNFRRYVVANLAAGAPLSVDLVNGTEAWGQNLVVLSDRLDLYVNNSNPWTVVGATGAMDAVGLEGIANTATTITDPDASLRIFRQINIPIVASAQDYTVRFFVKKDADTSRFPEFNLQLSGGTLQSVVVQLNTQTGAIAVRTGAAVFTSQTATYNSDWWELVGTVTNNGTNNLAGIFMYPAYSATLGGANSAALTGSIVVGNVELYRGVTTAAVLGQAPAYTPQTKAPEVNPS